MSKFCGNCGTELQDDAVVCSNCGMNVAPVVNVEQPQNPVNENITPAEKFVVVAKEKTVWLVDKMKSDKKFMSIVLGGVAGVLAIIVALVFILNLGGYNKAIEKYIDATYYGDVDAYLDSIPGDYLEDMLELSGMSEKDFKENFEKSYESILDSYVSKYGDDYTVDFEVVDEYELTDDDFEDVLDDFKALGISKKSITEAYEIEVEFTIDGSKRKDTVDKDFTAVKIDGDWYLQ